jgi:SAM-dependent methyltransferase
MGHDIGVLVRGVMQAGRWSPFSSVRASGGFLARCASQVLARPIVRGIEWIAGRSDPIPVGSIRFGHLKRLTPIDRDWGSRRGEPIDRVYIERFLAKNAAHIRGQVLELEDNEYTRRYGGDRIERSHVLSVEPNPDATIIANLEHEDALPEATFDCIILTQVLQYPFDIRRAVKNLYDALKPGGVLLVTAPGISPMEDLVQWHWAFTAAALCRLLADRFGQDAVNVEAHGNVYVATAFLYGLAVEDLDGSAFDTDDSRYPVNVAARAIKPSDQFKGAASPPLS